MIIIGVILLILSVLVPKLVALWDIGLIVLGIGVVLVVLSILGHPVGGRRNWF